MLKINSVVLYALLFTLAGCAEQPSEELEAARKAVEAARGIGADVYAGSEFRNASSVLKEAEAEIPRAMAEAFRAGNLGVMDYYRMRNIQADTEMRDSISENADEEDN